MSISNDNPDQSTGSGKWQPDLDPDYSNQLQRPAIPPLASTESAAASEGVPVQNYIARPASPAPQLTLRNIPPPQPVQTYRDELRLRPNPQPTARGGNVAWQFALLGLGLTLLSIFTPSLWLMLTLCWIVLIVAGLKLTLAWANHQPMLLSAAIFEALRDIFRFIGALLAEALRNRRRW